MINAAQMGCTHSQINRRKGMFPFVQYALNCFAPETSCLVAERCWDQVCWAIEAYAWRFAGPLGSREVRSVPSVAADDEPDFPDGGGRSSPQPPPRGGGPQGPA